MGTCIRYASRGDDAVLLPFLAPCTKSSPVPSLFSIVNKRARFYPLFFLFFKPRYIRLRATRGFRPTVPFSAPSSPLFFPLPRQQTDQPPFHAAFSTRHKNETTCFTISPPVFLSRESERRVLPTAKKHLLTYLPLYDPLSSSSSYSLAFFFTDNLLRYGWKKNRVEEESSINQTERTKKNREYICIFGTAKRYVCTLAIISSSQITYFNS